ncbi:hypothetical protein GA8_00625 [Geobacillus sp. A8]|nr:hypothetical protein GA8_00625 [Geobacillus sp. A8]
MEQKKKKTSALISSKTIRPTGTAALAPGR